MWDPLTVAFEIKYPWYRKAKTMKEEVEILVKELKDIDHKKLLKTCKRYL